MSLNTLVGGFFPRNADGAVLLLNALLAAGTTALAPLLVLLIAMLLVGHAAGSAAAAAASPAGRLSGRFWLYAAAVLLQALPKR
jgi:hypothetical protein